MERSTIVLVCADWMGSSEGVASTDFFARVDFFGAASSIVFVGAYFLGESLECGDDIGSSSLEGSSFAGLGEGGRGRSTASSFFLAMAIICWALD